MARAATGPGRRWVSLAAPPLKPLHGSWRSQGWARVAAYWPSYQHFLLQEFGFGTWNKVIGITKLLHFRKGFLTRDLMDYVSVFSNTFTCSVLRFKYFFLQFV